jgi:hypothetical protein
VVEDQEYLRSRGGHFQRHGVLQRIGGVLLAWWQLRITKTSAETFGWEKPRAAA